MRFLRGWARRGAVAIATAGLLSGCSLTFDATRLGVPVTMASAGGTPPEGERFEVTGHAVHAFWGLAKISEPNLRKALAAQLGNGSSVADLRIRVRSRFWDLVITGLTAGLVVPRSVTFEGVVVK